MTDISIQMIYTDTVSTAPLQAGLPTGIDISPVTGMRSWTDRVIQDFAMLGNLVFTIGQRVLVLHGKHLVTRTIDIPSDGFFAVDLPPKPLLHSLTSLRIIVIIGRRRNR
jgi:hypothetical protein